MFCSNCGARVGGTENYCPGCGMLIAPNMGAVNQTAVVTAKMSADEAYKKYWQNYVNFSGRARRKEYWYTVLFNFVVAGFVLPVFKNTGVFYMVLSVLWSAATLLPSLSLGFRRLHDIGKSAWHMLFALIPVAGIIILIVWYCKDGMPCDNQYGKSTKYVAALERVSDNAFV